MSTSKQCILVVEDYRPMLLALQDALEFEGYVVLTALGGQKALETLKKIRPDLIIADIIMPEMDGYELYQKVRARPEWQAIPFMFLTASTNGEHIQRAKELGIDAYIAKPVTPVNLLAAIHELLEQEDSEQ